MKERDYASDSGARVQFAIWGAEMIALDYDWDAAARQAAALGWPKWAAMLATGVVPAA